MPSEQNPKPLNLERAKLVLAGIFVFVVCFSIVLGVAGYLAKNKSAVNSQPQVSFTPAPTVILTPELTPVATSTPIPSPIINDKVTFGKLLAYVKEDADYNYMILFDGEKETIIAQGNANNDIGVTASFYGLSFSPKGNYLLYSMSMHEGAVSYVYDIKNKKVILSFLSADSSGFGFSSDEKYLYACSWAGMGSDAIGNIYAVPSFKIVYDALSSLKTAGASCRYDQKTNSIIYYDSLSIFDGSTTDIIRYSLKEQKAYRLDNKVNAQ